MPFQIGAALEDVGLTEQKDHFSRQLSGGQKRKLSVAIALIGDPKVLYTSERPVLTSRNSHISLCVQFAILHLCIHGEAYDQ